MLQVKHIAFLLRNQLRLLTPHQEYFSFGGNNRTREARNLEVDDQFNNFQLSFINMIQKQLPLAPLEPVQHFGCIVHRGLHRGAMGDYLHRLVEGAVNFHEEVLVVDLYLGVLLADVDSQVVFYQIHQLLGDRAIFLEDGLHFLEKFFLVFQSLRSDVVV